MLHTIWEREGRAIYIIYIDARLRVVSCVMGYSAIPLSPGKNTLQALYVLLASWMPYQKRQECQYRHAKFL